MAPNYFFLKIVGALKKVATGLMKSDDAKINKEIRQSQKLRDKLQGSNIGHIEAGRDVYIINTQKLPREIIDRLNKPSLPDEDFRVIESKFDGETIEYEKNFNSAENKMLERVLPHLIDSELRSILNLAMGVEYYFKTGDRTKAESIKNDIREFYGKRGNTLCNLYTSHYIDKILDYVDVAKGKLDDAELGRVVNGLINELLGGPAKYIYFVDEPDRVDALVLEARKDMEAGAKYIAFHGAGRNAIKVVTLVNKLIETESVKENYKLVLDIPIKTSHALFFVAKLRRIDIVK